MKNNSWLFKGLKQSSRKAALTGATLILSLAVSGCYLFPKETEVLAPPVVDPVKVSYDTMEVTKGDIRNELSCTGNFVYIIQEDLSFQKRGGRLKALHVKLGDEVKKGQLLAELETDSLKEDIAQQKIVLQKAKTAYEALVSKGKKDNEAAKYESQLIKYDIELAQLRINKLKDEYAKMVSMNSSTSGGAVYAQKDLDDLEKQIKEQQINLEKLQTQYKKGQAPTDNSYAIQQASQDMDIAALRLKQLEEELVKSKMTAPYAGVIVNIDPTVNLGQNIDQFKTFITIADEGRLQLRYSGEEVAGFELGMKVKVNINGTDYEGKVVTTPANMTVSETLGETDTSFVQIDVKGVPPGEVAAGDEAEISVVLQERKNVIVIPKNVVQTFGGQMLVYVLENGLKKERNIQIGLETGTEYEIVKGLEAGEKIIK